MINPVDILIIPVCLVGVYVGLAQADWRLAIFAVSIAIVTGLKMLYDIDGEKK